MKVYPTEELAMHDLTEAKQEMSMSKNDTFTIELHRNGYVIAMFTNSNGKEYFSSFY